ncbi:Uncharacterised protein [Roseburia intestinalis]|uniref:Uncharacterized protein n=1 Tax=Roseburia intestinalis TaxID=166486 RepID=A0A173R3X0_9FIRM|nr:Uncharacterised protein [Roseburia intestinalis]
MFFPSFFNLVKIQRVKSSSLCAENSTIFPLFLTVLYIFERLSTSSSTKIKCVAGATCVRYSARSSQELLKNPLSSINITLRSAKKGSVSARSITSFGLIFFPSNVVKFMLSSGAAIAFFNLSLYCFFKYASVPYSR